MIISTLYHFHLFLPHWPAACIIAFPTAIKKIFIFMNVWMMKIRYLPTWNAVDIKRIPKVKGNKKLSTLHLNSEIAFSIHSSVILTIFLWLSFFLSFFQMIILCYFYITLSLYSLTTRKWVLENGFHCFCYYRRSGLLWDMEGLKCYVKHFISNTLIIFSAN